MLTEQEVSEIMIEHIMTIEIEKSRENSGFRSGSSDERPRNNGNLEVQILEMIMINYGNQNQQPSRNEGLEVFLLKEVKPKQRKHAVKAVVSSQ